jgi:hypothetical protein
LLLFESCLNENVFWELGVKPMNCSRAEYADRKVIDGSFLEVITVLPKRKVRRSRKNSAIGRIENVMFTIAAVSVVGFGIWTIGDDVRSASMAADASVAHIKVMPGQTLWQIASGIDKGAARTDTVNEIRALNPSLQHSPLLSAGEIILVPVKRYDIFPTNQHLARADEPTRSSL